MSNTEKRAGLSVKKQPDPIDIYVGRRIRQQRNAKNMTQQQLSSRLGITFQQIQKYEKGINRVGASRLHAISTILEVPVSFFYADSSENQNTETAADGFQESAAFFPESCSGAEGTQLMRAFTRIRDPKVRRKIIDLTKALAGNGSGL